jgi:predicted aconitase
MTDGVLEAAPPLRLTARQQEQLDGVHGEAAAMAMRVIVGIARVKGATALRDITGVHIDSCLFHGRSGLDFVRRLVEAGGRVCVPTTTNVGSVNLRHPELPQRDPQLKTDGTELMRLYGQLGVEQTWTCAPYQLPERPALGEHVAWAESNAIVFANSVLGARTDRYGDFLDVCAAITGCAPDAGLHRDEERRATCRVDVSGIPVSGAWEYPLLGYLVGQIAGTGVPVVTGLVDQRSEGPAEDDLQAFGAAAASSGGVALFHLEGVTPECARVEDVCDPAAVPVTVLGPEDLERAQAELTTAERGGRIDAVCVGTPHASLGRLREIARLLRDHSGGLRVPLWVNTGRFTADALAADHPADHAVLERAGVRIVTDTCTYLLPRVHDDWRVVLTDSAKWAHYGPGNVGVRVAFGSLEQCVRVAREGWL